MRTEQVVVPGACSFVESQLKMKDFVLSNAGDVAVVMNAPGERGVEKALRLKFFAEHK